MIEFSDYCSHGWVLAPIDPGQKRPTRKAWNHRENGVTHPLAAARLEAAMHKTRKSAMSAGETRYHTGKPCKRNHVADRSTLNGGCIKCSLENQKRLRKLPEYKKKRNAQLKEKRSKDELLRLRERVYQLENINKRVKWGARYRHSAKGQKANRRRHLNRTYRRSEIDYDALINKQGAKCAICAASSPGFGRKFFAIDHDHKTGSIRGLLCHMCNLALGGFRDSTSNLRAAMRYLEHH